VLKVFAASALLSRAAERNVARELGIQGEAPPGDRVALLWLQQRAAERFPGSPSLSALFAASGLDDVRRDLQLVLWRVSMVNEVCGSQAEVEAFQADALAAARANVASEPTLQLSAAFAATATQLACETVAAAFAGRATDAESATRLFRAVRDIRVRAGASEEFNAALKRAVAGPSRNALLMALCAHAVLIELGAHASAFDPGLTDRVLGAFTSPVA
jgi:hypothetical protein